MRLGLGNRAVSTGCCGRMNRSLTNGFTYKRTQFVLDWSKSGMTGRIESDSMNIEKIRRQALPLPSAVVIETKNLRLIPHVPAHLLALMESVDAYEEISGMRI